MLLCQDVHWVRFARDDSREHADVRQTDTVLAEECHKHLLSLTIHVFSDWRLELLHASLSS